MHAVRYQLLDVARHLAGAGTAGAAWALYEAGKSHARASAPDHRYYAAVKDRRGAQARRAVRTPQASR
jgi:hypothetical protein